MQQPKQATSAVDSAVMLGKCLPEVEITKTLNPVMESQVEVKRTKSVLVHTEEEVKQVKEELIVLDDSPPEPEKSPTNNNRVIIVAKQNIQSYLWYCLRYLNKRKRPTVVR